MFVSHVFSRQLYNRGREDSDIDLSEDEGPGHETGEGERSDQEDPDELD